jgi:aspartate carbamoyltransferase catalytic subunit
MSLVGESFLSSEQLTEKDIEQIFSRAALFKSEFEKKKRFDHLITKGESLYQRVVALVFSEPSTRTRMSFQVASARLGMRSLALDNPSVASLSKGETLEDTFRNIAAMMPDLMVVRYNTNVDADAVIRDLPCPVISGGIGTAEHPTQALLDAFTVQEFRGKVKGEKVLIVGDVLHSRVANSNLLLLRRMGAEVAYCAPSHFEPKNDTWKGVRNFPTLNEGVEWASVIMGLRVQKERHEGTGIGFSMAEYREQFRLGGDQLQHFRSDGILLHPGPVIRGIEFSAFVMNDKRCKVLDQVTNGVFVRAALMSIMLGLEVQKQ